MTLMEAELTNVFNKTSAGYNSSRTGSSKDSSPVRTSYATGIKSDEDWVNYTRNLFLTARQHRREMVSKWKRFYRLRQSRPIAEYMGLKSNTPGNIPEIMPILAATVGWMTDQQFQWNVSTAADPFSAYSEYYDAVSDDLETVMQSSYLVNSEESEITKMLWDAFTYGTGFLKTTWDGTLSGGMGDGITRRVDLFTFYPDPAASSMLDANYFIEAKTMSIQEIDRRWPGSGKKIIEDGYIENVDQSPTQTRDTSKQIPHANPGPLSPATSMQYGRPGGAQISIADMYDRSVTVFECWVREHERYTTTVQDEDGKDVEEEHIFDQWRVIVSCGSCCLMNEPATEIWKHGQHPYSRYLPMDTGEFWGVSLVELLSAPAEILNRLLQSALANIELAGNPILVEDNRAQTQRTQITNRPGQRITKNIQGNIQWMEPPAIQQNIPEMLQYLLGRMETISGLSAVTKGSAPPGRNAQSVMDNLQEAAFVRIRMHLRNLEYALTDAGRKKASLITENYNTARMIAVVGPTGERSTLALRSRHFMAPTKYGATPMDYQLLVDAGAGTDTSRKVREDKLMQLFTLGAIDDLTLLEGLNIPNYLKIFQRVSAMKAAGAFQPPGARQRAGH